MPDSNNPFEMISGVPSVAAPTEIDVITAEQVRAVLPEAASHPSARFRGGAHQPGSPAEEGWPDG